MSLWARFTQALRSTVERFTSPPEPTYDPGDYPRGPVQGDDFDYDRESFLPPGWSIVGLYHHGEKTQKIHATDDTEVTDNDIAEADAIIVQYGPGGADGFKWIHGASGWRSIADQIEITIKVVSPKGTDA